MSDTTVRQLANALGLGVEKLMEQLSEAGMSFSGADQVVTSTEKVKLLGFLRKQHGKKETPSEEAGPRQITLRRKKVTEITMPVGTAKGKTVAVEVRQKRTYVKRSMVSEDQGVSMDREEALRLLKESEAKRAAGDAQIRALDERRLQDKKNAEEQAKKTQEAIVATTVEAKKKEADLPRKAKEDDKPAPRKDEKSKDRGKEKERERSRDDQRKQRGSHAAPLAGEEEATEGIQHLGRYLRGELHLAANLGGGARKARKKPKYRQDDAAHTAQAGGQHAFSKPTAPVVKEIPIGDSIVVADLAQKLAIKGAEVVKALFKMGVMVTINQAIDHDAAALVVEELGHKAKRADEKDVEMELIAQAGSDVEQTLRPPVVTIMGHVDHGKTSLLDYIRRTKVAAGEAGGITQHIGAYHVETPKGVVTFLDTPGHAAFTSMRARGAKLTDIVILVVAADDGVMPQTAEAIQHAKAANVPLIVAVNKIDKPGIDLDRVKQGLVQHEVIPEEWGGETIFVPVSAKTGEGIDNLLDAVLVQAEVMELKAVPVGRASGTVIESSLDKGRGSVATVLVQQGRLAKGNFLVCGIEYGRVRAMFNEVGEQVQEATPSIPVVLLGLSGVPEAGDDFTVVEDERLAKEVAQQRQARRRETRLVKQQSGKIEDFMAQMGQQGDAQRVLNVLVKTDVQGSSEALRDALVKISTDAIKVNVIASGVGGITESDATLAQASKAILIGFNVRADASARKVIDAGGVDMRYFSIIYDVIDQVKQAALGVLGTEVREQIIGAAEVRDVFRSSKFGAIAGCMVVEGVVKRNKPIRVLRDNIVVFQGELESLRRFKENTEEVRNGMECGIGVKQYNDIKVGDQIECYERIEVQRTL